METLYIPGEEIFSCIGSGSLESDTYTSHPGVKTLPELFPAQVKPWVKTFVF